MPIVKRVVVSASSSGDNTLVAAVTGKRIRVLALCLVPTGAVTVRLESAAGGTALTGQMPLAANANFVWPFAEKGWAQTVAGELLNLELSGAVAVNGALVYEEAA